MKLKPLDSPELVELAAGWLSQKENNQWLDFGDGKRTLTPAWLKIMTQRDTQVLRVFTLDDDETPIGIAGLSEINHHFKTARLWVVLGEKSLQMRGHGRRATSAILTVAFRDLGLQAVNTWVVEGNPSLKIAQRLNFTFIGRQRQCHYIDGRPYDRLWFDILAAEHKEE